MYVYMYTHMFLDHPRPFEFVIMEASKLEDALVASRPAVAPASNGGAPFSDMANIHRPQRLYIYIYIYIYYIHAGMSACMYVYMYMYICMEVCRCVCM